MLLTEFKAKLFEILSAGGLDAVPADDGDAIFSVHGIAVEVCGLPYKQPAGGWATEVSRVSVGVRAGRERSLFTRTKGAIRPENVARSIGVQVEEARIREAARKERDRKDDENRARMARELAGLALPRGAHCEPQDDGRYDIWNADLSCLTADEVRVVAAILVNAERRNYAPATANNNSEGGK